MASSVWFGSVQPVAADGTDVTTGYPTDGVADVIWAAEHLNYDGPGGLQKAGVQVLRFLLVAVAGVTDDECDTDLGADLDPSGPHLYTSTWSDDEVDALDWVADHYCLTPEQTQLLGGGVLAFLASLDAAVNGTSARRADPPPVPTPVPSTPVPPTTSTTTTTTVVPNPGNTMNCSDFSTYAEAKAWFDTYFPYYGDVARLDGDNDGEPCESLPGGP